MSNNISESRTSIKVIGAGWGRTGTMSLRKALNILGVGPCYHMIDVFENNDTGFWIKLADGKPYDFDEVFRGMYQSSCDVPSCIYWKEMLAKYPDAKVILTTRSPESWYNSIMSTVYRFMPGSPNYSLGVRISHWIGFPHTRGFSDMVSRLIDRDAHNYDYSKEGLVRWFMERNQRIIEECPKEKLLVFEAKDGWAPLCKFLDHPIPDVPYPHENDMKQMQHNWLKQSIFGYSVLALAITVVLGIGYVMLAMVSRDKLRMIYSALKGEKHHEL